MYVYNPINIDKWAVGHFTPTGDWINESYQPSASEAAQRVAFLNGKSEFCPHCKVTLEKLYEIAIHIVQDIYKLPPIDRETQPEGRPHSDQ